MKLQYRKPVRGHFTTLRLEFRPEFDPLPAAERSQGRPHYPTALAYLDIYLDGKWATQYVPSTYLTWLLDHLLTDLESLLRGDTRDAKSLTDPWMYSVTGYPASNRAAITVKMTGRGYAALESAVVALSLWYSELIMLAEAWKKYLIMNYPEEVHDPELGDDYRRFDRYLQDAKRLRHRFESL